MIVLESALEWYWFKQYRMHLYAYILKLYRLHTKKGLIIRVRSQVLVKHLPMYQVGEKVTVLLKT